MKILKLLRIENSIASLIYGIANGLLGLLQFLLNSLRRPREVKTILFFRTGSLGDMLCALPVFREVRRNFSSAKLILLTQDEPIFDNSQPLSNLIGEDIFEEIIYYRLEDLKSLSRIYALAMRIRKYNIEVMLYLSQSPATFLRLLRDMLFFYLSGCRKLYGFRLDKHRLFRIAQRYYRAFDHEIKRLSKVLLPLGIFQRNIDFTLPISEQDKYFIDNLWPNPMQIQNRPIIGINSRVKFSVSHWPKERFLKLAKGLIDEYKAFILIIGGKDAQETCGFIEKNLPPQDCLNVCGRTNFMQTAEAISRCELLISCDSGVAHLAAAVHKPVIGIYTAKDYPNSWYPYGNNHIVIRHDVPCQICLKSECLTMECIKGISVEEVLDAVRKIRRTTYYSCN